MQHRVSIPNFGRIDRAPWTGDPRRVTPRILSTVVPLMVATIGACCTYPKAEPATGTEGAYVRAIPGDVRAGVVGAPPPGSTLGWPPVMNTDPASPCTDEVARVQSSLGVVSVACPTVQTAVVPGQVSGDDPIPAGGFNVKCYDLGTTVLVVEHTEVLAPKHCTRVVGLAVFHRGAPP